MGAQVGSRPSQHDYLSTLVLHSPLMYCPAGCVVKHTFIEFHDLSEVEKCSLRRNKSESLLLDIVLDSTYPESSTPTTCCSVIGDDEYDVQSLPDSDCAVSEGSCYDDVRLVVKNTFVEFRCLDEETAPKLRRQKSEPALAYAAFALITPETSKCTEAAKPSSASSWADISELDSIDTKSVVEKKVRRSGRARQREQRRRRARTPSPEMRAAH